MAGFFFGVLIIATALCINIILRLPFNTREDFVVFAVCLVLGVVFFISAMMIGTDCGHTSSKANEFIASQTDKRVIQCILQSATITCSLPQSNIQGEIK